MTAQVPEILIHRGKTLDLCSTPLDDYLRRLRKPSKRRTTRAEPEEREEKRRPAFRAPSTACYRGYVGRWEIREGKLYLLDLEGVVAAGPDTDRVEEVDLRGAMPWLSPPVLATWFTGELRCVEGRLLDYVHAGFASLYERDRFFDICRGEVEGEFVRLNPPPPIIYEVAPDGTRIAGERCGPLADKIADPSLPDEAIQGYEVWGTPPADDEDEEEGYVVGAALWYPLELEEQEA